MKTPAISFRAWVFACNAAIPLFAVIVITRVVPFHNHLLRWAGWVAMAMFICLGSFGAMFGLLMCFGRLRMRCPFCGAPGVPDAGISGSRPHLCMECPHCGRVETSGRFVWRIHKTASAAVSRSHRTEVRRAGSQVPSTKAKGIRKIAAILFTDWGDSRWRNYPFSRSSILSGVFCYLFIATWLIVAIMAGLGRPPATGFGVVIAALFAAMFASRSFDNHRERWTSASAQRGRDQLVV